MSIIVFSGPTGVGKTSVVQELLGKLPNAHKAVTFTTRSPRAGERHGVDYYFCSVGEFQEKVAQDAFLEYEKYGNNFYGCPRDQLVEEAATYDHVFVILDVRGAASLRKSLIPHKSIFLAPPSMEELLSRLEKRATEGKVEQLSRISQVEREMASAVHYDYMFTNSTVLDVVSNILPLL